MDAFYTIALLQAAHCNMPYRAWELRPTGVDEALLIVTTVFATIQIQIKVLKIMFYEKHLQIFFKKYQISAVSFIKNLGCFHKSSLNLTLPLLKVREDLIFSEHCKEKHW